MPKDVLSSVFLKVEISSARWKRDRKRQTYQHQHCYGFGCTFRGSAFPLNELKLLTTVVKILACLGCVDLLYRYSAVSARP